MLNAQLDHIISRILDRAPDTSDIIFTVGKPVQVEVHGELRDAPVSSGAQGLLPFQVESVAMCMMGRNPRLYRDLVVSGSCDLSYELPGRARFRVNVFGQKGSLALVMRKLSVRVPTMEELALPRIFSEMATEKYGLILVTGGTGTGKSTTLAALIDAINGRYSKHIVTLEDPIEFVHGHKKGVVNQRELGVDFDSFSSGLRAALRQAPKVILVGEIRDRETIKIALEAAETGHLVLGTLHTSDAGQTVNRIIGMFELAEERLIRTRLSESLKFVVSQRLMARTGGGRVAAFEVMRTSLRVRDLIANGEREDRTYRRVIASGSSSGMITFDQYLTNLYLEGSITEETAMVYSSDRTQQSQALDKIKAARGEKVTDIDGLEIDAEYERANSR